MAKQPKYPADKNTFYSVGDVDYLAAQVARENDVRLSGVTRQIKNRFMWSIAFQDGERFKTFSLHEAQMNELSQRVAAWKAGA